MVTFRGCFALRGGCGWVARQRGIEPPTSWKECLRHGIDPFIIDDKRRGAYNRGIAAWSEDHAPLISVSLEAQKRFQGKMELCKLFQYAHYPEPYQGGKR